MCNVSVLNMGLGSVSKHWFSVRTLDCDPNGKMCHGHVRYSYSFFRYIGNNSGNNDKQICGFNKKLTIDYHSGFFFANLHRICVPVLCARDKKTMFS